MSEANDKQGQAKKGPKCDPNQLELLLKCSKNNDINEWNKWVEEHPKEEIWLQRAEFKEAILQGANLQRAHLENADFGGAHLEGAKLWRAHMEGIRLWNTHLEGAKLTNAHLEGASLVGAHLENANLSFANLHGIELMEANLEGANLYEANVKNAKLWKANLRRANLISAHLEDAEFIDNACLQNTNFTAAIVNGGTLIWDCEVDMHTDFCGVGLDSMRIEPSTKQILKYNIRCTSWKKWYKWKDWYRYNPEIKRLKASQVLRWPVQVFWAMSDYGRSTGRIILTFFILALFFAALYSNLTYWYDIEVVSHLSIEPHTPLLHYFVLIILRPIYFSVVTMTTLGFGDMYANTQSIWGHVLLTVQVLLGYILLGALVTRFAILFTAGGPEGTLYKKKKKKNK